MPLSLQQVQKLSQRLIMTPQMQLSVKLLQMNALELDELAQQELLENPFLEMEEDAVDGDATPMELPDLSTESPETQDGAESPDGAAESADMYETAPETINGDASTEMTAAHASDEMDVSATAEVSPIEEQPERFDEMDLDWSQVFDDDAPPLPSYLSKPEEGDERSMEEVIAGRSSLYEVLERQLRLSALEGKDQEIGQYLIGSIDERGFLQISIEDCAQDLNIEPQDVERVLSVIQEFDPSGVGARNLPECLLIQLEARGQLTPVAREVLEHHWDDLLKKKFRDIARSLKTDEREINDVFERIRKLNPAPGATYGKEQPQYIQPDVHVKKIDDRYMCYLNEGQVAHLRLSNAYKDILIKNNNPDPQAREYAIEKYRAAVAFIKNIEKRRSTILRVTEAIMDYQHEFLEKGVEALRPLALSEIANAVSMHESTISRVTSGKYVSTPQGLFELKFFFSSAIESNSGEAASSRSIKQKIRELVDQEDPRHPLSDDKITQILKDQGFSIARRTVAKYREQMKILPTNLRKKTG